MHKRLQEKAIQLDDLFCGNSPFMDPFSRVKTPHLQLSYYRTHFNFIVSNELHISSIMKQRKLSILGAKTYSSWGAYYLEGRNEKENSQEEGRNDVHFNSRHTKQFTTVKNNCY